MASRLRQSADTPTQCRMFLSSAGAEPVLLRFRKNFEATATPCDSTSAPTSDSSCSSMAAASLVDRTAPMSTIGPTQPMRSNSQPGQHRLEALAWTIGPHAPVAQISWRGGFVLKAEGEYDEQLTTGKAPWEVAKLDGSNSRPGVLFRRLATDRPRLRAAMEGGPTTSMRQVIRSPIQGQSATAKARLAGNYSPPRCPTRFDREINAGRAVALGGRAPGQ